MALEGWDAAKFTKQFEREELRARKKTWRALGRKNVAEAKKALGRVKPKRRSLIKYKVRKNGTLVHIDSGADSRVREYGMRAEKPLGKTFRINLEKKFRDLKGDFIADIGRTPFLFQGEGKNARPIAVLKRTIRREPVSDPKKLSSIVEKNMTEYEDMLKEELENG